MVLDDYDFYSAVVPMYLGMPYAILSNALHFDYSGYTPQRRLIEMPELAEVEHFRRPWDSGFGSRIVRAALHSKKRVFRGTDVAALEKALTGATLLDSEGHGKQMLFRFRPGGSIVIHLGMSGQLRVEGAEILPGKHDHLVLFQDERSLVYSDPRMFGRVQFVPVQGFRNGGKICRPR